MKTLNQFDLFFIRNRLPRDVRNLLINYGGQEMNAASMAPRVFLAGGFVRSVIAREEVNDIDLFANGKSLANQVANELADKFQSRVYSTDNAYTVRAKPFTLQVIHRWTFPSPQDCVASFDYTIARAAVWASTSVDAHGNTSHTWASACDPSYYEDLAARRLVYRSPVREEAAGGSFLRLLKFYRRGYTAPLDTIAAVMSRMAAKIEHGKILAGAAGNGTSEEKQIEKVLLGLLHEVDPNSVTNDPAYLTLKEETDES
jgi:hypothetical protein